MACRGRKARLLLRTACMSARMRGDPCAGRRKSLSLECLCQVQDASLSPAAQREPTRGGLSAPTPPPSWDQSRQSTAAHGDWDTESDTDRQTRELRPFQALQAASAHAGGREHMGRVEVRKGERQALREAESATASVHRDKMLSLCPQVCAATGSGPLQRACTLARGWSREHF